MINVIGIVETLYKFLLRWMGVLYIFFLYVFNCLFIHASAYSRFTLELVEFADSKFKLV